MKLTDSKGASGHEQTGEMDDSKIGMSRSTLVSSRGEAKQVPQFIAAIIANMGGFIAGLALGWSSPVNSELTTDEQYNFPISTDAFSWISSVMPLGALAAGPLTGWMVDAVGRKKTILILVLPSVVGWAFMIWAQSVWMFCIGRFVSGFAGGGYTIVVPLYINEWAEVKIRGTLGTYFQLQLNLGILFTYVVGSVVNAFWLTVACAIVSILYGCIMLFLPESPIFFLKTQQQDKAQGSLQWFRGREYDVEPELTEMQKNIDQIEAEKVPMLQAFSTTAAKRGLIIGLGVMAFQQLGGVNAVIFYTTSIFTDAGSTLDSNVQTIIVGCVNVVFTYVATLAIDRTGRRPLLLLSDFFMAVCTFVLGLFFYLQTQTSFDTASISWLPIIAVALYLVFFALGYGPIPWMFVGEVFPRQISGYACSLCCMFNWFCAFLVTKFYSNLNSAIGSYGSFWTFTVISAIGTVFTYFLVPETKNKTIEQIQRELGGT